MVSLEGLEPSHYANETCADNDDVKYAFESKVKITENNHSQIFNLMSSMLIFFQ